MSRDVSDAASPAPGRGRNRPKPNTFALERQTTPVRIAAALREEIARGALPPGTRLHEVDFTAAFGVSRHTLREAVSLLVGEGLLTRTSFKGVEVTRLTADDIQDIYAARRLIELGAVDALGHSPAAVLSIIAACDALAALPATIDSPAFNKADLAVHAALVAAHGSKRMSAVHAALTTESQILLFDGYDADDISATMASHAEFADLLRSGRYAAARTQLEWRLRRAEGELVQKSVATGSR